MNTKIPGDLNRVMPGRWLCRVARLVDRVLQTGMPLVDGTRTILDAMAAEGVERYIGIATPSLPTRATRQACSA